MIIVTRKYMDKNSHCANTEFKVFADDDVRGLQDYLDENGGSFDFKKL